MVDMLAIYKLLLPCGNETLLSYAMISSIMRGIIIENTHRDKFVNRKDDSPAEILIAKWMIAILSAMFVWVLYLVACATMVGIVGESIATQLIACAFVFAVMIHDAIRLFGIYSGKVFGSEENSEEVTEPVQPPKT